MIFNFRTNVIVLRAQQTIGNPAIRKIGSCKINNEKYTTGQ